MIQKMYGLLDSIHELNIAILSTVYAHNKKRRMKQRTKWS